MTRVCLYMRISTDEDHQPTSLGTQRERLERYCQAMEDWHVVHAFEDQTSGVTLDRPGLMQALGLARERRFDLLLVYRVDRLSRKVRQLAGLAEELDRLGIVLKSATEPFDTGSPAGRMMLQMLGVFAEFEHATIVDRVTAGLERRVREGRWMSGRTPYGYTRADGLLVPDPVKAPVVRRIFQLYAEGKLGTTAIARQLEAEGAPAPRRHGWSPNALQLILANPAYRGLIRWKGNLFEGLHEPLVDQELFDKAHQLLRRRGENASLRRGNPSEFLLSGLVRCHHCGRAYVGTSAHGRSGRYTYYACSTRYKYGPNKCSGERLPKDRLEAAVLAQLADLYRDGRLIERALAKAATLTAKERPRVEEQLASTRAEIARVERKLERYFEAFEAGDLSAVLCQERVRGHRERLEALRGQEADLARTFATQAHTPPDTAALTGLADQLDEILTNESPEQAKELLRLLIKEIRVHNRRRIIPTYRVPAAVRAIPSKVGGTGLEPVTPSLSSLFAGGDVPPAFPIFAAQTLFLLFVLGLVMRAGSIRLCVFCASAKQPFGLLIGQRFRGREVIRSTGVRTDPRGVVGNLWLRSDRRRPGALCKRPASPLLPTANRRQRSSTHEAARPHTPPHQRCPCRGVSRFCVRTARRARTRRLNLRASGRRGSLPLDRRVDRRPHLGDRTKSCPSLGLYVHDGRLHRVAPCVVCGGARSQRPSTSNVAESDGSTFARARGLPPSPLVRAPERSQGRVPGDSPLHNRRRAPRRVIPARERPAPLCARRTPAHGHTLPELSRPQVQVAFVDIANVTVGSRSRLRNGRAEGRERPGPSRTRAGRRDSPFVRRRSPGASDTKKQRAALPPVRARRPASRT